MLIEVLIGRKFDEKVWLKCDIQNHENNENRTAEQKLFSYFYMYGPEMYYQSLWNIL